MGPGMGPERGSCRRKRTRGDAASGSVGADAAAEEEEGPQDLQSGMRARAAEKVFRRWGTAAADTSRLPPGAVWTVTPHTPEALMLPLHVSSFPLVRLRRLISSL